MQRAHPVIWLYLVLLLCLCCSGMSGEQNERQKQRLHCYIPGVWYHLGVATCEMYGGEGTAARQATTMIRLCWRRARVLSKVLRFYGMGRSTAHFFCESTSLFVRDRRQDYSCHLDCFLVFRRRTIINGTANNLNNNASMRGRPVRPNLSRGVHGLAQMCVVHR